jgi:uncharacterized protein DUF5947
MSLSQMNNPFATLRGFARARATIERCELCSAELRKQHPHLVEPNSRKIVCSCESCAILFDSEKGKYRRVPSRSRFLPDFRLTDAQWEGLMIPINMAFFFYSTPAGKVVALYPSPAGPTESLLTFESWSELEATNPILNEMNADVEALLVNRVTRAREGAEAEYYLAPIDECYKLTGLIRAHWRGLSGGAEVWEEIRSFFAELKKHSTVVGMHASGVGSENLQAGSVRSE